MIENDFFSPEILCRVVRCYVHKHDKQFWRQNSDGGRGRPVHSIIVTELEYVDIPVVFASKTFTVLIESLGQRCPPHLSFDIDWS